MGRNTINTRIRRDRLFKAGLCVRCGQVPPADGNKCCQTCSDKQVIQTRLRRERLLREGLCTTCGKVPPEDGSKSCLSCLKRQKEYHDKRAEKELAAMPVVPEPVPEPVSPDEVTDKRHEYPHCQWLWTFSVDCPTVWTMAGGEWAKFGCGE